MVRRRIAGVASRARAEVLSSVTDDTTPKQVAGSFALGTFITMLPTLGTGLLVFVVLVYLFDWLNKIALAASVVVFNPVVKWGVYIASITLGFLLFGPVEGVGIGDVPSLNEGSDIVLRLLVGNLILAVVATVVAYTVVHRLMIAYEREAFPLVEEAVTEAVEEAKTREPVPEATESVDDDSA